MEVEKGPQICCIMEQNAGGNEGETDPSSCKTSGRSPQCLVFLPQQQNDIVRLRAALSVIERMENLKVGCTDSEVIQQDREQNRRLQKMWEV